MLYSNDDIKKLYLDIGRITKFDNTVTSLEELEKKLIFKINVKETIH